MMTDDVQPLSDAEIAELRHRQTKLVVVARLLVTLRHRTQELSERTAQNRDIFDSFRIVANERDAALQRAEAAEAYARKADAECVRNHHGQAGSSTGSERGDCGETTPTTLLTLPSQAEAVAFARGIEKAAQRILSACCTFHDDSIGHSVACDMGTRLAAEIRALKDDAYAS